MIFHLIEYSFTFYFFMFSLVIPKFGSERQVIAHCLTITTNHYLI